MKAGHTIKTQRLEMDFNNEARAQELHSLVRELCCAEVERSICSSLDLFNSIDSVVYTFTKIELNLGTMEWDEVRKKLPERISQELQKVLKEAFVEAQSTTEMKISVTHDSDLSSFIHFLQQGFLPWNSRNRNLVDILLGALDNRATELANAIRQEGSSLQVRKRITERFSSQILQKIVSVLEPENSNSIIGYQRHLADLNKKWAMTDVPQPKLEKTLWLFVFNHLLTEQDSYFNRKAFALSVLRQFSCHFNIEFNSLLLLMHIGWQLWKGSIPVPFKNLIEELTRASMPRVQYDRPLRATTKRENALESKVTSQFKTLDDLLDDSSWEAYITDLMNTNPKRLVLWLEHTDDKPRTFYKLVSKSTPQLPKQILKKIRPVESSDIIKYHVKLMAIHTTDPIPNTTQREVENILWTFMLVHLMENQGSYFNHKSFLKSLITSFSAHYNVNETALLEKLISSAHCLPVQSTSMRGFLLIIKEIYVDLTERVSPTHKKSPGMDHSDSRKITDLFTSSLADDAIPHWEKNVMQAIDTGSLTATELKERLENKFVRDRIILFSNDSFTKLTRHLFDAPEEAWIDQFVLLTKRMENQLMSSFNSKAGYTKAVRLAILGVTPTARRFSVKQADLLNLLLRAFIASSSKLKLSQVLVCAAKYSQDHKLQLFKKLIKTNKHTNSALNSMITQLVSRIIESPVQASDAPFFELASTQTTLTFLHMRYPEKLLRALVGLHPKKKKAFVARLQLADLDLLFTGKTMKEVAWSLQVLQTWEKQWIRHKNRKTIIAALKRALLGSYVLQESPSEDILSRHWLTVLEKYNVFDSSLEAFATWSLPRFGDPSDAIQAIEKKVQRDMDLKQREKAKLLKESLRNEQYVKRETKKTPAGENAEGIYINNAGLVLIHPYLPFLFEQTRLLTDGNFNDEESRLRAVALLQYAVTGAELFNEEEHMLNKLLCGMDIHENSIDVKLRKKEKKLVNEMLLALAEHWPIIKNSTPDDIRGNWLVREGRLKENADYWELIVKRQPYDLLMDSLPFNLSPVKYSWMKKMMMIQWL